MEPNKATEVTQAAVTAARSRYGINASVDPSGDLILSGVRVPSSVVARIAASGVNNTSRDFRSAAHIIVDKFAPVSNEEAADVGVSGFDWHLEHPSALTRIVAVPRPYATARWFPSGSPEQDQRVLETAVDRAYRLQFDVDEQSGVVLPSPGQAWASTAFLSNRASADAVLSGSGFDTNVDYALISPSSPVVVHADERFLVRVAAFANRPAVIVPIRCAVDSAWGAVVSDAGVRR